MKRSAIALLTSSAFLVVSCSEPSGEQSRTSEPQSQISSKPMTESSSATPDDRELPSPTGGRAILHLDGLDELKIGQDLPERGGWAVRGSQINEGCKIASSPEYPNVHSMLIAHQVRRITVTRGSQVRLQEGIGTDSTLADVRVAFPGFRETPHKYWEAGLYVTQPGDEPRLMFEIDPDGRVANVHVGLMPELAYVEGCA